MERMEEGKNVKKEKNVKAKEKRKNSQIEIMSGAAGGECHEAGEERKMERMRKSISNNFWNKSYVFDLRACYGNNNS